MKFTVQRADPAGNITLFVLSPVHPALRPSLAERLMEALPDLHIEQVGYRCSAPDWADGQMEMAGGEFCGNATRAYGYLIARERGGMPRVRLVVSGAEEPVNVDTDLAAGTSRSEMPLPREIRSAMVDGTPSTLVDLGGIAHLVVENVTPELSFFEKAEPVLQAIPKLDAYGVIFLNDGRMTPLVKVPASNTLVWEGSCGSGTLAAAIAQSLNAPDGDFVRDYVQPAGTVQATVRRENGSITAAWIGGPVQLDDPFVVEL